MMNAKGSRVGLSSPASATSYASRRTAGSCWLMLTNKPDDSGSLRKKVLKGAAERAKIHGLIGWHSSPQLPRLARRDGCSSRRATETYASRQHRDHDERLRRCLHGSEAQSQHVSGAARAASRPHQISKCPLLWTASVLAFSTL